MKTIYRAVIESYMEECMIYRYHVVGSVGTYEGWAHTPIEMKEKIKKKYGEGDCEVFFAGGEPKHLSLEEYRDAMEVLDHNHELVMIYDKKIGDLLERMERLLYA